MWLSLSFFYWKEIIRWIEICEGAAYSLLCECNHCIAYIYPIYSISDHSLVLRWKIFHLSWIWNHFHFLCIWIDALTLENCTIEYENLIIVWSGLVGRGPFFSNHFAINLPDPKLIIRAIGRCHLPTLLFVNRRRVLEDLVLLSEATENSSYIQLRKE